MGQGQVGVGVGGGLDWEILGWLQNPLGLSFPICKLVQSLERTSAGKTTLSKTTGQGGWQTPQAAFLEPSNMPHTGQALSTLNSDSQSRDPRRRVPGPLWRRKRRLRDIQPVLTRPFPREHSNAFE